MSSLMVSQIIAGMMSRLSFGFVGLCSSEFKRKSRYSASHIHETKKGPGRSKGTKQKQGRAGNKMSRQAFNGVCTLRNGIGDAGILALNASKPR